MKKLAVIVREKEQQYEALRSSLGALLEIPSVKMIVLDHEVEMTEPYKENMEFLDEMEGERYSNNKVNVEKYGFKYATLEEIGNMLKEVDIVIPF